MENTEKKNHVQSRQKKEKAEKSKKRLEEVRMMIRNCPDIMSALKISARLQASISALFSMVLP